MPMYASPTRTGPYQDSLVQEELSDLMVMSPSQRLRTKGFFPLVPKRSHKYCQNEDCVFNRKVPGQLARKDTGQQFCTWCDNNLLMAALQESRTEMNIKVALAMFKQRAPWVYRLALEKLAGHELSNSSFWCNDPGCVYLRVSQ